MQIMLIRIPTGPFFTFDEGFMLIRNIPTLCDFLYDIYIYNGSLCAARTIKPQSHTEASWSVLMTRALKKRWRDNSSARSTVVKLRQSRTCSVQEVAGGSPMAELAGLRAR